MLFGTCTRPWHIPLPVGAGVNKQGYVNDEALYVQVTSEDKTTRFLTSHYVYYPNLMCSLSL